jgi:hypothetical protein
VANLRNLTTEMTLQGDQMENFRQLGLFFYFTTTTAAANWSSCPDKLPTLGAALFLTYKHTGYRTYRKLNFAFKLNIFSRIPYSYLIKATTVPSLDVRFLTDHGTMKDLV